MVDNIQGSEFFTNRQIQQKSLLEALTNSKKSDSSNPYNNLLISDSTEISDEALKLFEKTNEIEYYKQILLQEEEEPVSDKVALIKAQIEAGTYKMPSNEELASAMLEDQDFKTLLDF